MSEELKWGINTSWLPDIVELRGS